MAWVKLRPHITSSRGPLRQNQAGDLSPPGSLSHWDCWWPIRLLTGLLGPSLSWCLTQLYSHFFHIPTRFVPYLSPYTEFPVFPPFLNCPGKDFTPVNWHRPSLSNSGLGERGAKAGLVRVPPWIFSDFTEIYFVSLFNQCLHSQILKTLFSV